MIRRPKLSKIEVVAPKEEEEVFICEQTATYATYSIK